MAVGTRRPNAGINNAARFGCQKHEWGTFSRRAEHQHPHGWVIITGWVMGTAGGMLPWPALTQRGGVPRAAVPARGWWWRWVRCGAVRTAGGHAVRDAAGDSLPLVSGDPAAGRALGEAAWAAAGI